MAVPLKIGPGCEYPSCAATHSPDDIYCKRHRTQLDVGIQKRFDKDGLGKAHSFEEAFGESQFKTKRKFGIKQLCLVIATGILIFATAISFLILFFSALQPDPEGIFYGAIFTVVFGFVGWKVSNKFLDSVE
jgi:hypothetical protein